MNDQYVFVVEFDEFLELLEELDQILEQLEPKEAEEIATSFFSSFEGAESFQKEQNFEEVISDDIDFEDVKPRDCLALVFDQQPNLRALDYLKDKSYTLAEKYNKTIMGFKILKRTHEVIYEE